MAQTPTPDSTTTDKIAAWLADHCGIIAMTRQHIDTPHWDALVFAVRKDAPSPKKTTLQYKREKYFMNKRAALADAICYALRHIGEYNTKPENTKHKKYQ